MFDLFDMNFWDKISNFSPFQRNEGWVLIEGVGAYSRGSFLIILCPGLALIPGGCLTKALIMAVDNYLVSDQFFSKPL